MSRNYQLTIGAKTYEVTLLSKTGNSIVFRSADEEYSVDLQPQFTARADNNARELSVRAHNSVRAPMPGIVASVLVSAGDQVSAGSTLLIIEAMKMENNICAQATARIKKVLVKAGQEVRGQEVLIELE